MGVPPNLQSAMFVSSHVVYTFSWVFVPTWNKFYRVSHSEIRQCKKDKDLLSLGLQHIMNFLKNITADLDSSWSSKFERGNRRSQVNEPFNEKSSFNDRSNRSLPTYLPTYPLICTNGIRDSGTKFFAITINTRMTFSSVPLRHHFVWSYNLNCERTTGELTIWLTIDDYLTVCDNRRIETHQLHYESS